MLEPERSSPVDRCAATARRLTRGAALATTYTLDLHSLLLAPLAMAAYDHTEGDAAEVDAATPVALLESIRRHAEHTTVLCQAAGIHVPAGVPKARGVRRGLVAEVAPPPGGTFHPKIWLLRFVDADGSTPTPVRLPESQPDRRPFVGHRPGLRRGRQRDAHPRPGPDRTFVDELLLTLVPPARRRPS